MNVDILETKTAKYVISSDVQHLISHSGSLILAVSGRIIKQLLEPVSHQNPSCPVESNLCHTVQRSPETRLIIFLTSAQEVADGVLRSAEDVRGDQGELADGQGPVVRRRVLPLAHRQQ